jgi:glucose/arabinose dehydrogenase
MRWWLVVAAAMLVALGSRSRADVLSSAGTPSPADTFDLDSSFVTGIDQITDLRWLGDGRMVILTKTGTAYVRPAGGGAPVTAGTFSVDSSSEKGLLGVAVDPQFAVNGRLYFYYSADAGAPLPGTDADRHRVVVRTLSAANQLGAETLLLHGLRGPANHDGGALDVGPDGYLYVGVGDTGNNSNLPPEPPYTPTNFYPTCLADDPSGNGAGNGKILRIALDGSIPASNPLVGATNVTACGPGPATPISPASLGAPRTEVYAWGFRNPFRLWVDPQTGRVWVGDVGEISYEEIDVVVPGRHHGWPWREGRHGWPTSKCQDVRIGTAGGGAPIQDQDCVEPAYFCRHDDTAGLDQSVDGGCDAITGGQIVDSCDWPAPYAGLYYFADNANGSLFALAPNAARDGVVGSRIDVGSVAPDFPVALRTGDDGALYVAVYPNGGSSRIVRIAPKAPVVCTTTTTTLGGTTTTTLAACAGLAGSSLVACQLDAASTAPLCAGGAVGATLAATIHARFHAAAGIVRRAAAATRPHRMASLLGRADARLAALVPRVRRLARKGTLGDPCRTEIEALIEGLRQAVESLVP